MEDTNAHVLNKAIDENNRLRVSLVPMPSGDNPWRTQGDYRKEQKRDTIRFWLTITALILTMIGTAVTAITAVYTIKNVGGNVAHFDRAGKQSAK